MIDLATLVEGEITQIDYDADHGHRITVIRVDGRDGGRYQIRFTYPSPDWGEDLAGRNPVVLLRKQEQPGVSVARLA